MGWTIDGIKSELRDITPEKRIEYLRKEYQYALKDIYKELFNKLMTIQKKMSLYHNGYEEIKRGKAPSEIRQFLIDLGYSEARNMPNPSIVSAIKWILKVIEDGIRELTEEVNEVLIYVTKALGSATNLESVSVTATIPPSITFNFKLESTSGRKQRHRADPE